MDSIYWHDGSPCAECNLTPFRTQFVHVLFCLRILLYYQTITAHSIDNSIHIARRQSPENNTNKCNNNENELMETERFCTLRSFLPRHIRHNSRKLELKPRLKWRNLFPKNGAFVVIVYFQSFPHFATLTIRWSSILIESPPLWQFDAEKSS